MQPGDLTTLANVKQWLSITGLAVTAISNASSAVLTLATRPAQPLLNGAEYSIEGATGMTGVDGTWTITVLSPTTFSIPFDSTAAGTYTSGAIVGITDPLLSRLITAASTAIQSWLNRTIASAEYTEYRDGQNMPQMMLQNYPVTAVQSLTVQGLAIQPRPPYGPDVTSANFGGYVFDANRIMLSGYRFPRGFQNVVVQYTAGYATTPTDVEQACIDIIGDWFKYRERIGLSSMGIEGQSVSFDRFLHGQMPSRAQMILNQYKRVAPSTP